MISIKPVPLNACFSMSDNLDPDAYGTEESDLRAEKHHPLKTSTDAGGVISTRPVL
jgi:hypothetical protein